MRVLAVDPGTRGCGAAIFVDGVLLDAAYVANSVEKGSGPGECAAMAHMVCYWTASTDLDVLVCEIPQIYSRSASQSKGDPNKIMPLFGVDAALAALYPLARVEYGVPSAWKGNIPKPKSAKEPYAIEARVRERLSSEEQKRIRKYGNVKHGYDVTDAIGIGLSFLGRFERRRVYARE